MATVKSIDVALRANTTEFEAGMRSGMSTMKDFSANADRIAAQMGKAATLFQSGAIGQQEYTRTIKACDRELNAISAGFGSMSAAIARTDSIMRSLETDTERYQNSVRELSQLNKIGAMNADQYAMALRRTNTAYQQSLLSSKATGAATDKLGLRFAGNLPIINQFGYLMSGIGTPIGIATGALVGAGIAVKGFSSGFKIASEIVQAGLERIEKSANFADQLGILTAEFQKLEYAVGQAGVSPETLTSGMQTMNKTISEAISGNKRASETFRELNVDISKLSTMSPDKAFRTLADAIASIQSPFDRTRLSMAVFGKSGGELVRVLREGSESIEELGRKAERLRIPVTQVESQNIKEANAALNDLTKAFEGLGNVLTTKVAPILTVVVNDITRAIEAPQQALDELREKWQDVIAAFSTSTTPFEVAYKLSGIYFDSVSEKAAEASNATAKAADGIKRTGAAFDPAAVEEFMSVIEEASKRQAQIAKTAVDAQKRLQSEQRVTAQQQAMQLASISGNRSSSIGINFSTPRLPQLQLPAINLKANFDDKPLFDFESKLKEIQQRFAARKITVEIARTELQTALDSLEQLRQIQVENAKATQEAEQALHKTRLDNLKGFLSEQQKAWAKNNPALAAYQELNDKIAKLNDLTRADIISLEKRNQLVAFFSATTKSSAVAAQEELKRKVEEVNDVFRAGLITLEERNRLLMTPGVGTSPAFDDAKSKLEDMKSRGKSISESVKNPFEKFTDTVRELQQLRMRNLIDPVSFGRAIQEAQKTLASGLQANIQVVQGPAAVERGTQEAFSAFHKNKDGVDRALEIQKKMEAHLAKIARGGVVLASAKGRF